MIYYNIGDVIIRTMCEDDPEIIHAQNLSNGWHSKLDTYTGYFRKQGEGTLCVFVAECGGEFAGYTTMRSQAAGGAFANMGIPEISDFNVFAKYRRRGIGTAILAAAEAMAGTLGDTVCLGVGLHKGYGAAQRLYIKRGYVPDGSGVWYEDRRLEEGAQCRNDDGLILYLSKKLRA